MWELVNRFSHGRYPVRRILLLAITGLMTFLVASLVFLAPTAYADAAERQGDNLLHRGRTLTPAQTSDIPADIRSRIPSVSGYRYIDTAAGKAYFILTTSTAGQATTGQYTVYDFTPPANFSNPSPPEDITISAAPDAQPGEDGDDSGDETPTCDSGTFGGTGWFVCSTVGVLAAGMDKIYEIVSDFLVVRTVTNDTNSPLYHMWMVVRDIANICFVIAILVIVYSQLTSIGISNYGIKKLLPRLIIGAVLVNVSFWICAVAVDASNILGYGIHNLFVGIRAQFMEGSNFPSEIPTWQSITAVALAGTGAVAGSWSILAGSVTGSAFLLIPILVGAVCAILVALLVLAARQALITVFIIIAPLAFVAYLLPNTEKWFTKWREAFMTLLLLFPIFSVIFSGAQLAGMAIVQTSGGNLFIIILGLGVQVAPVVITPMIVKFSGGLIGKIAGLVNNPNKGLVDRTRKWAEGAAQERKNKVLADQTMMAKSKRFNRLTRNPLSAATKGINNINRTREGRRKAYETMADNTFAGNKYGQRVETMNRDAANDKKDVENRYMRTDDGRRTELRSRHLDVDKTEIDNSMMRSNGGKYLTYRQGMAETDKTRVHNEFEESSFGHKLDTAKRTVELEKKKVENAHQASWDDKVRTDAGLLELDLSVKRSEARAGAAKIKLEKMHSEILAQGDKSEHILNLRGVDAHTQAGMLNIAHDLKNIDLETNFATNAKTIAEYEVTTNRNNALLNNANITVDGKAVQARTYAAGIGGESGQASVLATAVAKQRKEHAEDVSHQKELASHFKLSNEQIMDIAKKNRDVDIKDDHGNIIHTFRIDNDYVRDMAIEEAFKIGSHNEKMDIIKKSGKLPDGTLGENYNFRRTIQQAIISTGFASQAPSLADKSLDLILRGEFSGDESMQYHSLREILEGRIKANTLSTSNADSLKVLFADVDTNPLAQSQFNALINDEVARQEKAARDSGTPFDAAAARAGVITKFNTERDKVQQMAVQVLKNSTISQNAASTTIDELKKFAGSLYRGA